MRTAAVINGSEIVNVIAIDDGPSGDAMLSKTCVEITDMEPKPALGIGWKYSGGKFIPPVPLVLSYEEEVDRIKSERRARYAAETDGLYFEAMRGDGNLDAWNSATAQIRADLPYPEAP